MMYHILFNFCFQIILVKSHRNLLRMNRYIFIYYVMFIINAATCMCKYLSLCDGEQMLEMEGAGGSGWGEGGREEGRERKRVSE